MIFQDPMTALNPVRSIGDQLLEAVTAHAKLPGREARARAVDLLTGSASRPRPGGCATTRSSSAAGCCSAR